MDKDRAKMVMENPNGARLWYLHDIVQVNRKSVTIGILLCGGLVSCYERFEDIELGDGFYESLKGAEPLLHAAGNEQLWRKTGEHRQMVWPYLVGNPIVTNGIALFNGGLTDDHKWKGDPAIFVFLKSGPAIEVSEGLTKFYSEKNDRVYSKLRGEYAYKWPLFTNGVFVLSGSQKPLSSASTNSSWIDVSVTMEDLIRIANETKTNGVHKKYRSVDYIVQE